ncbi:cation proton exchanger, putative [Medicago truncatula]|uniref:Cation proton exchanger, putative n=1 Tax=Medicago truncatula TaxID=3880 RepID=G7K970_MEDTR|nr:cation proton exchanger, putative [Medicago truncatula]
MKKKIKKIRKTDSAILACFHSTYNIPTLINLIESSRGTRKQGKLCIYAMHLIELSERPSAITMVHKARNIGMPFWNKKQHDKKDQMVIAFEAYGHLSSVIVRPMTTISSLNFFGGCDDREALAYGMNEFLFREEEIVFNALELVNLEWVVEVTKGRRSEKNRSEMNGFRD